MSESFCLADAGNTYNPALLVLRAHGFELDLKLKPGGPSDWIATKGLRRFVGTDPLMLLGLVRVWEHFGDDWNRQMPAAEVTIRPLNMPDSDSSETTDEDG